MYITSFSFKKLKKSKKLKKYVVSLLDFQYIYSMITKNQNLGVKKMEVKKDFMRSLKEQYFVNIRSTGKIRVHADRNGKHYIYEYNHIFKKFEKISENDIIRIQDDIQETKSISRPIW